MVPGMGTSQQSVTFTPTDTIDYTSVSGSVQVTVNPVIVVPPVINGLAPAIIKAGSSDGYYFSSNLRSAEPCGDALMALYMLLTLSAPETGVEKVGFFDEIDFTSEFLQIGGPRRTSQLYL